VPSYESAATLTATSAAALTSSSVPAWSPVGASVLQHAFHVVPVKDNHHLFVNWTLPSLSQHWHSTPSSYVSSLLGHEGEGSLLSALMRRGWAVGCVYTMRRSLSTPCHVLILFLVCCFCFALTSQ
jgi:secreted Zn-dependent insulinase-like peptidase